MRDLWSTTIAQELLFPCPWETKELERRDALSFSRLFNYETLGCNDSRSLRAPSNFVISLNGGWCGLAVVLQPSLSSPSEALSFASEGHGHSVDGRDDCGHVVVIDSMGVLHFMCLHTVLQITWGTSVSWEHRLYRISSHTCVAVSASAHSSCRMKRWCPCPVSCTGNVRNDKLSSISRLYTELQSDG